MRRTGAGPAAEHFYDEHVEADAVHEQVVRHEVIGGLLDEEPHLAADVAFGIDATGLSWRTGSPTACWRLAGGTRRRCARPSTIRRPTIFPECPRVH